MFALRYLYRPCPWRWLEFMCSTLDDYILTKVLSKGLHEEWSYEELSLLQAWLGKEDWVNFHVISKPSYSRRLHDDQGSIQGFIWRMVMWREELSLLQAWLGKEEWVNFMFISKPSSISRKEYEAQVDTWRRSLARLSHNGVWGSIWRSRHQACASKRNQERWSTWRDQDRHHLAQVECARQRYDLDRFSVLPVSWWKLGERAIG